MKSTNLLYLAKFGKSIDIGEGEARKIRNLIHGSTRGAIEPSERLPSSYIMIKTSVRAQVLIIYIVYNIEQIGTFVVTSF